MGKQTAQAKEDYSQPRPGKRKINGGREFSERNFSIYLPLVKNFNRPFDFVGS